jgi:hypothetical protein
VTHTAIVSHHLTVVLNPETRAARVEIPSPEQARPFAVDVAPHPDGEGWIVTSSLDMEPAWRASFTKGVDAAISLAAFVLADRVSEALGRRSSLQPAADSR